MSRWATSARGGGANLCGRDPHPSATPAIPAAPRASGEGARGHPGRRRRRDRAVLLELASVAYAWSRVDTGTVLGFDAGASADAALGVTALLTLAGIATLLAAWWRADRWSPAGTLALAAVWVVVAVPAAVLVGLAVFSSPLW